MTSLSTSYWQLFLAQGVCCGLGNGCLFCPSLSLLSTYFSKKRSLALGIAAAGSATGGMVFPAMVQQLLPKIGFAWTMRSLGFIQLGCLIICNIGIRPRIPPRRTGALVDWKSFKEAPYVLFAAGMFFVSSVQRLERVRLLTRNRTSGVCISHSITSVHSPAQSSAFHTPNPSTSSSHSTASESLVESSPTSSQIATSDP